MNNQESLRTQIIESMKLYCDKYKFYTLNERMMFDEAIMPVLDAAMKAGELLLHRATTPQKPVSESIVAWLEQCCYIIATIRPQEATASKRELLNVLYQLEEGASIAIADARKVQTETASEALGRLLDGKHSPRKVEP